MRWTDHRPLSRCYVVNMPSFVRKSIPVMLVLLLAATVFAESGKGKAEVSVEKWKSWIGKKVDVDYTACDQQGCVLVRNAELKQVNDKAVVVIVGGSPLYIPKYMITRVTLSKTQGQKLKSD